METLNTRLQDFNTTINETVFYNGDGFSEQALSRFIARHHERGLRVTIIRSDGTIAFDNIRKDYVHMGNHRTRPEVVEALRTAPDRLSTATVRRSVRPISIVPPTFPRRRLSSVRPFLTTSIWPRVCVPTNIIYGLPSR